MCAIGRRSVVIGTLCSSLLLFVTVRGASCFPTRRKREVAFSVCFVLSKEVTRSGTGRQTEGRLISLFRPSVGLGPLPATRQSGHMIVGADAWSSILDTAAGRCGWVQIGDRTRGDCAGWGSLFEVWSARVILACRFTTYTYIDVQYLDWALQVFVT